MNIHHLNAIVTIIIGAVTAPNPLRPIVIISDKQNACTEVRELIAVKINWQTQFCGCRPLGIGKDT